MTRRRGRRVAGAVVALVAVGGAWIAARTPSLDRTWDEDVRVLAGVDVLPDSSVRLSQVRHWRYSRDSVLAKDYLDVVYDPDDVQGLWLYEQDIGLGGLIAHTFLVFEFPESYGDARWLGLSVETRREVGETYSVIGGMLRRFEVTHIWALEDDLVRRRVEYLDYPLTRYRVTVPHEALVRVLRAFLDETAALAHAPRWYNTLTTNCTSSLMRYVNAVEPDAIPWHYSYVVTGRADDYLSRLGYVDGASAQPITRDGLAEHLFR